MFNFISWKFCNMLSIRCLWFRDFVFSKKLFMTVFTDNHLLLSSSVKLFWKSQSSIICWICGLSKTPSLILALWRLGNLFFKKKRPASGFLFSILMKFVTIPSVICNPGHWDHWDHPVIVECRSSFQVLTTHALPKLPHYNVGNVLCCLRCIESNSISYSQIAIRGGFLLL